MKQCNLLMLYPNCWRADVPLKPAAIVGWFAGRENAAA